MKTDKKIPVVIVTGFLGAGKTTFINEIIKSHRHLKLALVENEFGATSVDKGLIVGMRSENIFDLSNGCICCSISNEFSLTLLELAKKAAETDYLLIETTGVANLSNIIRPFYADEDLKERFVLKGSICLIDAVNHEEQLKGTDQQVQVILSDLLIINKISEVDKDELSVVERKLQSYNSSAVIRHADFGVLDNFMLEFFDEMVQGKLEKKLSEPFMYRIVETKKFTTFTHQFPGNINLKRFQYWFNYFVAINQLQIYRIKGVLYPDDQPEKVIVQSVGGAASYENGSMIGVGEEKLNTLVFIGTGIDNERIAYELDNYLSDNNHP